MKDGYSICYNEWALDPDIKNELGLLLIISSLCAEKGYCYATNDYLANLFDTNESLISRKIKKLEQKGYIRIDYKKRGCEVINREIRLSKMITDDYLKSQSTIIKIDKENNINNNNTNNNIYGEFKNVKLSDSEYHKLEQANLIPYIEKLSSYIASKGKRYKSHYATILTWARKDSKITNSSYKKQNVEPEWLGKEIKKEEISDEAKRIAKYIRGEG